ncbi:MAG: hypothetical protein KFB96_00100 [Thiocapsa sp.]|uniref:hypothetical protein n=1 Tax=Thiocapsa sp. TaxID=2024551 RepID=UPI001BCF40D2|nr:hypothetical protein [Thiocapsa sp.]QVL48988.1 MAG: hypothetical protein KFB96_00100 [Thiocapsa sp.]
MGETMIKAPDGLDHRLVQLLAILASSGLPALIPSGQDGLTTHSVAAVGEGMIEAIPIDSQGFESIPRRRRSIIARSGGVHHRRLAPHAPAAFGPIQNE